jgi:hypothetical protein
VVELMKKINELHAGKLFERHSSSNRIVPHIGVAVLAGYQSVMMDVKLDYCNKG